MRKTLSLIIALTLIWVNAFSQEFTSLPHLPKRNVNLIIINDSGAREEEQREASRNVAASMADIISRNNIAMIAVAGDIIHDKGVKSADDPEWDYKYAQIFSIEPLTDIPWYVVPGNHEYYGKPKAVAEYAGTKDNWDFDSLYYSVDKKIGASRKNRALFVFLDTFPMIESKAAGNKNIPEGYLNREISWADSVLTRSDARWKIVIGHHPVFAHTDKKVEEREDMQRNLLPVLDKGAADLYVCGHIHNFQYIVPEGSRTRYLVNTSASRTRKPHKIDGTVFCKGEVGFTVLSISKKKTVIYLVNKDGEVIFQDAMSSLR